MVLPTIISALVVALLGIMVTAQGGIWYKLGKLDGKLSSHLEHHNGKRLTDGTTTQSSRGSPAN